MSLSVSAPVLWDGLGNFKNNALTGVQADAIVVGVVQMPTSISDTTPVDTLQVKDRRYGTLYLSWTLAQWQNASNTTLSSPAGTGGALPLNEVAVGTGSGITSFPTLIYNPSVKFAAGNASGFGIGADFATHTAAIGDLLDHNNKTKVKVSDNDTTIQLVGANGEVDIDVSNLTSSRARIEPDAPGTYQLSLRVTNVAYGTTVNYSLDIYPNGFGEDFEFNSSTGGATVLLPTGTNAEIGVVFIISDLLAISNTSNITVDAGIGNTINAATIAQTKVMNVAGACWTLKKVTATAWKLQ